jgi:hypothetical protein
MTAKKAGLREIHHPSYSNEGTQLVVTPEVSRSQALRYDAHTHGATNGFATMDAGATAAEASEDQADILHADVADAALERAAMAATPGGAMSFPNAPTVSILVVCCSFDGS